MRDSNSIKKDEKYIPHFRRTELFPSGGGIPEGKEGEQYSHVSGLHHIPQEGGNNTFMIDDSPLFRVGEESPQGRWGSNIPRET